MAESACVEVIDRAAIVPDQVDVIVFDVIGTLVEEDQTWARIAERLAAEAGLDETAGLLHRGWSALNGA